MVTFTYKVIHEEALTQANWQKPYTKEQTKKAIDDALFHAFTIKCNVFFKAVEENEPSIFTIYIKRGKGTTAAYYRNDGYIVLDVLNNDRGWYSERFIGQTAAHEIGHSPRFFGSGHDNSIWTDINGKERHHMMNAYANNMGETFTSPKERDILIRKYGKNESLRAIIISSNIKISEYNKKIKPLRNRIKIIRERREVLKSRLENTRAELEELNNQLKNERDPNNRTDIIRKKDNILYKRRVWSDGLKRDREALISILSEYRTLRNLREEEINTKDESEMLVYLANTNI